MSSSSSSSSSISGGDLLLVSCPLSIPDDFGTEETKQLVPRSLYCGVLTCFHPGPSAAASGFGAPKVPLLTFEACQSVPVFFWLSVVFGS